MIDETARILQINQISTAFRQSQILFAALDADLFSLLEEPHTAAEVAQERTWDTRATRIFLDALMGIDLLAKSDDRYIDSPAAAQCLIPGRPAYQGNIVRHQRSSYETWGHILDCVPTGQAAPRTEPQRSPEELSNFILGMADIAHLSAQELLGAVDFSPYSHILDIGGGPGTYSIAFLEQYPGMRATVFDRPEVLEIAKEQVGKAGLLDRVTFMPGDLTCDSFGSGYDLVLISNIIHMLGADANRALVRRCREAMESRSMLVIKDFLTENDRSGPPFSLLFALHMLLNTGEGDTYTYEDVAAWTDEAGFMAGFVVDLTPQSRLWVTQKP
jgi:3-hydroxy-5-methyl-1-naphthoate 3-O-methyltransferase